VKIKYGDKDEWLEPDGLGGFASGTAVGIRTRRYHALLLTATTPPTGRVVLVNGFDAWLDTAAGSFPLTSQRYEPGVVHPNGATRISEFSVDPWPTWVFALEDGTRIEHAIIAAHGAPIVGLTWRIVAGPPGGRLSVRPFLSGRDYHSMHRENGAFRFAPESTSAGLVWRPYDGIPAVRALSNGEYHHQPDWYRNFRYEAERDRGLDYLEDLASPGVFSWTLDGQEAVLLFGAGTRDSGLGTWDSASTDAIAIFREIRASESTRRAQFPSPLHRAADAYLVTRGSGKTIVAGYPWFTDWGRDTFIALRGICLAAGRIDEARSILLEWSNAISEGMLPNRFPDRGEAPEFNSVDASLWFVIATYELFDAAERAGTPIADADRATLEDAVDRILTGYAKGTRYGIGMDQDGLLAAGVLGVQLTWMDAKVGDYVVTPRIGKPVEVQALWLNALWLASPRNPRWRELLARGQSAFAARFWNEASGSLHDVVDVDHHAGSVDASFRPNQIFALGGLPITLVDEARARRAIDAVEARLWTPLGLRSLAQDEPGYVGHYRGGVTSRDGCYHQGTVWPWLLTSFVEAWVRIRGGGDRVVMEARERFLTPLLRHLDEAGLGHISEIADGDAPHSPNGCPFQAWSVGEALRLDRVVLSTTKAPSRNPRRPTASNAVRGAEDEMGVR
jgi:predicted glycogen debranching enzyme